MKNKIAMFTDIHFGKKNNSQQHNEDCLDFVKWFCIQVKKYPDIKQVIFLGDWFENRNAVNVQTLNYAHSALKLLNALNIPLYIIIGNHDLYHRENRTVFSTQIFDEFSNVTLVNEPMEIDGVLICPFLFRDEYPTLAKFNHLNYWFGHFEFRNFVITGTDRRMEHGPDHTQFTAPTYIFSGHFHKRQANGNVIYLGNTFPMDYGDSWDDDRGLCILDTSNDDVDFIDWAEAPKYRKIRLSDLLSTEITFPPKCRVRCLIDVDINYSDAQALKEEFTNSLGLREFILEENLQERDTAIAGDYAEQEYENDSLDDSVIKMLQTGIQNTTSISVDTIIKIYSEL